MKRIMAFLCVGILISTIVGTALADSDVKCIKCGSNVTVSYGPWNQKMDILSPGLVLFYDERTVTLTCTKGHTTTTTQKRNMQKVDNRGGGWDRMGLYARYGLSMKDITGWDY